MGVSQFYDAMIKMEKQPKGADDPVYKPPHGHDHEMSTSEREGLTDSAVAAHKRRLKGRFADALIGSSHTVDGD